jgi:hypothetical protein
MVSIDEELKAAQAAKAVVGALLTRPISTISAELRKAKTIAVVNLGGGGGSALNEARANVGIALSNLMDRPPMPEGINNARAAIDAWIRELEAADR